MKETQVSRFFFKHILVTLLLHVFINIHLLEDNGIGLLQELIM